MEIDNLYSTIVNPATFAGALDVLARKGYHLKFRREFSHLICVELYRWINPDQFTIDGRWYFEKVSTPDTDRMIYAITTNDGAKGILVDTCNVYADNMSLTMIRKLEIRDEQLINADENSIK